MASEERVLSVQRDWANGAFDGVAVHFDATVDQQEYNPSQYLAMYLSASPVGDLAEACVLA